MGYRGFVGVVASLMVVGCGSCGSAESEIDGGGSPLHDASLAVVDGQAPDGSPDAPPTCGGGAMFVADHLIIPAGPEANALGVARWRLLRASWEAHTALRAAGFDDAGRLVLEGQWVLDVAALSLAAVEPATIAEALAHTIEQVDGTALAAGSEQRLWEEIGAYLSETPCVLELDPWVPAGRASSSLSVERGASARCSSESLASFRAWLRLLPQLVRRLYGNELARIPRDLEEPFRRIAEHNCCMGANTPLLGVEGCTCVERFGPAFPVRREYPDPNGGFDAEHVCEACPRGLEWRDDLRRCGAPLDGPPAPEVGACPSAGAAIDYGTLRARLEDVASSSPQIQLIEVVGGRDGACAPLESVPLYVPCSARDGVPFLARPAGGAIDTNPTAGLLGSSQWLWHVSYAVEGMLDRGLLASGDVDGTGSIYSTGYAPGTPEITVCDDAMAAGPFGGRAVATPIIAFPDRVVDPEERAAAGLDPTVSWCADRFIAKFSTTMLRCNPSRIRGSNFLVLFPESESCGGALPPQGVTIDASATLCVCPLDAPRWDPDARSCACTEEGRVYDPVEGRCRPEERCFGALGAQCTPLQRDPAFTGIFPVSCGIDHVGPPRDAVPCTADPWFREVVDTEGRALQWQAVGVGSLRHDQCCRRHPQGFFCGEHGSLFGTCREEFNLAIADFLTPGATWGRLFDPETPSATDIFVDGDWRRDELTSYGRGLRAGAGADVRDGDGWACASGETWDRPRCQRVCAPDATGRGRLLDGTRWPFDDKNDYDNPRPVYRQPTASSCGAAAVAMVLEDESAMGEMIERCSLDDDSGGTTARELAETLRRRDQLYTPVQLHDLEGLAELIEASGSPAIALIETVPGQASSRHWSSTKSSTSTSRSWASARPDPSSSGTRKRSEAPTSGRSTTWRASMWASRSSRVPRSTKTASISRSIAPALVRSTRATKSPSTASRGRSAARSATRRWPRPPFETPGPPWYAAGAHTASSSGMTSSASSRLARPTPSRRTPTTPAGSSISGRASTDGGSSPGATVRPRRRTRVRTRPAARPFESGSATACCRSSSETSRSPTTRRGPTRLTSR